MQSQLCMHPASRRSLRTYHAYFFNNGHSGEPTVRKGKVLVDPQQREGRAKRVLADTDPSAFFPAAAGLGHRILRLLAKGPNYPSMIARELELYHQVVYYHMKRLEEAGLVERVSQRMVRGGKAQFYALASDGYAIEFDVKGEEFGPQASLSRSGRLGRFLKEFISDDGQLDGWIVCLFSPSD